MKKKKFLVIRPSSSTNCCNLQIIKTKDMIDIIKSSVFKER